MREKITKLTKNALDFHCHGIGRFDFTEIDAINLQEINDILVASNQGHVILTLYLPRKNLESFIKLMNEFAAGKKQGKFSHIQGIALEGPILASRGGTPKNEVWTPTKEEWRQIAACGALGLIYVVISPDAYSLHTDTINLTKEQLTWMIETLLEYNVLPAPGHFTKGDPATSAHDLQNLFDIVSAWGKGATISDHLFNDMPHNFRHAWRTRSEKEGRIQELAALQLSTWTVKNMEEKMGIVPSVLIKNSHKGLVKLCQNFDGEHVDLAICKKAVEIIGAENMIAMTDSIESHRLAGRNLKLQEDSTLLYQSEGIVAAGTQPMIQQIGNMFQIGLTVSEIESITHTVPFQIIKQCQQNVNWR